MHIELTVDEYLWLLIALGFASAAAHGAKDSLLVDQFLRVTNAVGRNSPNYIPYTVGQGDEHNA